MDHQDPQHIVNPELVRHAARGDAEAIRMLWQQHRRWVAAILLAHKPRDADLEDLLQDVAMTLVNKATQIRDEASFKPWLRMVAVNTARAAGRKKTRRQQRRLDAPADPTPEPEGPADRVSQRDEAHRLMGLALSLPEAYREPLLLRCVHGMSYRQIGAITDLPETTIETRIARGRRMLRELANQASAPRAEAKPGRHHPEVTP